MAWRGLIAALLSSLCLSCGPPGLPNSAYGMQQPSDFDDGGDLDVGACMVTDGCAAGETCCGKLCCGAYQVCCMDAIGNGTCGAPDLVGDSCGSGQPFGP